MTTRPQNIDDVQAMVEAIDATLANHGYPGVMVVSDIEITPKRDSFDLSQEGMLDAQTEEAIRLALDAKTVFSTPVGRVEAWY